MLQKGCGNSYPTHCTGCNLIAAILKKAIDKSKAEDQEQYNEKRLTNKRKEELISSCEKFLKPYHDKLSDSFTEDISEETYKAILEFVDDSQFEFTVRHLLYVIDGLINPKKWVENQLTSSNDEYCFTSLNSNVEDTGIILLPNVVPKVEERSERKTAHVLTSDVYPDSFNVNLNFCYYVLKNTLSDYTVINHCIDKIGTNGVLKVGIMPICPGSQEEVFLPDDLKRVAEEGRIVITGISERSQKTTSERLKAGLKLVANSRLNLFMAPEMIACDDVVEKCTFGKSEYSTFLRSVLDEISEEGGRLPDLSFLPTYWREGKNTMYIANGKARLIAGQEKQHPMRMDIDTDTGRERAIEGLNSASKCIHLIHIVGVGRIAVTICYDFLVEKYKTMLADVLKVSLFVVPSCSSGQKNFKRSAMGLVVYDAYMMYDNSSAAYSAVELEKWKEDYFCAVSLPTDAEGYGFIKGKCEAKGRCEKGCIYTFDIPLDINTFLAAEKASKTKDTVKNLKQIIL